MKSADFREEYARLMALKESDPELVQAALGVLNKWGTEGPLLLYVAEGLKSAYEAGKRGRSLAAPQQARTAPTVRQTSETRHVRTRPKR